MVESKAKWWILIFAAISLLSIAIWNAYGFFETAWFYLNRVISCEKNGPNLSGEFFCNGSIINTLLYSLLYLLFGIIFLMIGISLIRTIINLFNKRAVRKLTFTIYVLVLAPMLVWNVQNLYLSYTSVGSIRADLVFKYVWSAVIIYIGFLVLILLDKQYKTISVKPWRFFAALLGIALIFPASILLTTGNLDQKANIEYESQQLTLLGLDVFIPSGVKNNDLTIKPASYGDPAYASFDIPKKNPAYENDIIEVKEFKLTGSLADGLGKDNKCDLATAYYNATMPTSLLSKYNFGPCQVVHVLKNGDKLITDESLYDSSQFAYIYLQKGKTAIIFQFDKNNFKLTDRSKIDKTLEGIKEISEQLHLYNPNNTR